ncbi:DUF1217 domain-containing protein [Actibacterium sp.]|uniref:DUF1217 domain-containing protein n=1 Tax=Actibacterium sp. TaxID=1872125 RepID=UPI0035618625
MSFTPVVPFGGFAGWRFLERTMPAQKAAHEASPVLQRDIQYFRDTIGKITSAEALVADRRLLGVALGAFGLDDDINNRFFIRKVLEDGSLDKTALANRLADKRYLKLTEAFGFGDVSPANTQLSDFPDTIIDAYKTRQFEIAVGDQNADMRLALNMTRELVDLATGNSSDDTKWFTIMGSEPLRQVFETALGLPTEFAALDIDKQLDMFRSKTSRVFGQGDIAQFSDPEKREDLLRLFLVRADLKASGAKYSPASTALTLLQTMGRQVR